MFVYKFADECRVLEKLVNMESNHRDYLLYIGLLCIQAFFGRVSYKPGRATLFIKNKERGFKVSGDTQDNILHDQMGPSYKYGLIHI